MAVEVKDVVNIDFEALSEKAMLIQEFRQTKDFKTKEVTGYVGEFIITEGRAKGLKIAVNFPTLPDAELMGLYNISFDEVESKVYAIKDKFGLQLKLVGRTLIAD